MSKGVNLGGQSFGARAIKEQRESPFTAKELRLQCPHCTGVVYVTLAYPYTAIRRQRAIHDAIDEHRRVCEKAPPEHGRIYTIEYPRS